MTDYDKVISRSDAGALIPEDVARDIIQGMPASSAALSLFARRTMSRGQQRMPVLDVLPVAYWVNGDTGLKKTSEQLWKNVYLYAEELAVIVPIPEAVLDDQDYDLWGEIKPRIVEAFGAKLDAAVFFGTDKPASWPTDVVTAATAAGNDFVRGSVGSQKLDVDVGGDGGVMALVEADGFDVSGFVARKGLKASLRGLRDADGQPILGPITEGGGRTLYGESIFFAENGAWDAAKADLIAGDFSQGIIAVRTDISYKVLDQAVLTDESNLVVYNLAQQDMVALRAVARFAFAVPNPVNRLQATEASRYPFGVLRPVGYTS